MNNGEFTIMEMPPENISVLLIVLGDKKLIDDLIEDFNIYNNPEMVEYISVKIDYPCANKLQDLIKIYNKEQDDENNKCIYIDNYIETAQCYTYADGYSKNTYMLMELNKFADKYVFGFPKFDFTDDDDPEDLIENWFRKKIKKVPSGAKKNMKFITTISDSSSNILIISTKIKKKKEKNKNKI